MICGGSDEDQLIDTTDTEQQEDSNTFQTNEDPFAAHDTALLGTEPSSATSAEPSGLLDDFAAPSSSAPAARAEQPAPGDLIQF
eukprot:CAMPEP_0197389388 /NCGR_PEP_ID=MMETSP1165-20131217/1679_1 /TAXON_ID=284809 /ORGANISM="Chrysocystis fragilis, Strain CCMP3189" /LENGTH=83 /DNA_ID=CAMNT_0042914803 /DNA_START=91 /DNA_END=342 /DNA_ORIENTATION=-